MESTHEKALRLIYSDRVRITFRNNSAVNADVTGDHSGDVPYLVCITQPERARCSCPAHSSDCSHILAVLAKALYLASGVPPWVSLLEGVDA